MTEADTQNRQLAGKVQNRLDRHARFARRAGARRDDDALRLKGFDFSKGHFIVANDLDLGTQLAKVLNNVVSE
ncbi:hypothetical protein D3C76_1466800 [compost metagenome]